MSGKLRLKLIVHCFQFAAEAKRRHLSPGCFSSDNYQMIYPVYYPVLLSDFIIRSCRAALLPMQQSHEVIKSYGAFCPLTSSILQRTSLPS